MNYEETLSTLKAIQASYAPVPFLANPETEPRFVIDSDTREIIIPEEFKFLAVKMDHMSEKIYFEIPRYFDDEDLATKICVVQYINTNGEVPIEAIVAAVDVDTESEDGKIIFRWDVDNYLTRYAGVVSFAVRFYTISDDSRFTYSWNTLPATLPVLDTLDNTNDTVSQNYPTELVQWQFRMSELDRTISDKIAEASESIDVNTKAAQEARKGAEDAESRVNAIVAGNEAYTKQQSHDLFALALKGTAEAAKSITIYPDKGSNVVVTAHGFTTQAGTGDPSPTNVRALTNGGLKLVELVLTGAENWAVSGTTYPRFYFTLSKPAPANWTNTVACTIFKPSNILNEENKPGIGAYGTTLYLRESKYNGSVEVLKADLSAKYAAGNPVIVWYQPADESQATGLYAPIILQGGEYRATCLPLTAPLCEGDSVVSWAKSGCDKMVVLKGDPSEDWRAISNANYARFNAAGIPTAMNAQVWCNKLSYASGSNYVVVGDGNSRPSVFLDKTKYTSVEDWTNELAQAYGNGDPYILFYQSTNYTPAADIPVSLETHVNGYVVFSGGDDYIYVWRAEGEYPRGEVFNVPRGPKNIWCKDVSCSHFIRGDITVDDDVSGIGVFNDVAYMRNGNLFSDLNTFKQFLSAQYAAGTPVTIVYELATPITYAHDPVDFIADPDDEGAWVITGEADGTVSAEYNKNITKALEDILTRVSALELYALGG